MNLPILSSEGNLAIYLQEIKKFFLKQKNQKILIPLLKTLKRLVFSSLVFALI